MHGASSLNDWANLSDEDDSRLISKMRSSIPEAAPSRKPESSLTMTDSPEDESPIVRRRRRPSLLEKNSPPSGNDRGVTSTGEDSHRTPETHDATIDIEPQPVKASVEPVPRQLSHHQRISDDDVRNLLQSIMETNAEEKR